MSRSQLYLRLPSSGGSWNANFLVKGLGNATSDVDDVPAMKINMWSRPKNTELEWLRAVIKTAMARSGNQQFNMSCRVFYMRT